MKKPVEPSPKSNLDPLTNFLTTVFAAAFAMLLSIPAFAQDGGNSISDTHKQGIITPGTVRVNNLANLEALLNFTANGLEILLLSYGIWMLFRAFRLPGLTAASPAPSVQTQVSVDWGAVFWAVALILLGLALPGTINWFCASSRDMSYFSLSIPFVSQLLSTKLQKLREHLSGNFAIKSADCD